LLGVVPDIDVIETEDVPVLVPVPVEVCVKVVEAVCGLDAVCVGLRIIEGRAVKRGV